MNRTLKKSISKAVIAKIKLEKIKVLQRRLNKAKRLKTKEKIMKEFKFLIK